MELSIDALLERAVAEGASDIHLKVGASPVIRSGSELRRLDGTERLRPADTESYAAEIFTPLAAAVFEKHGEADFAYGRHDLGRFRVTAFRQRGSVSLVLRRVMAGSPTFDELGLPPVVKKLVDSDRGLIIVNGPSGSGKTSTMSSMIDWINTNRSVSIVTVEDPIEVLHPDKSAVVAQREVGVDTPDFGEAVRTSMRHDTDVIMISHIDDADTAAAAIIAAETGHLVITSMRTTDPADTVNRLLGFFGPGQQKIVRAQLASQLQAIISQRLVTHVDTQTKVLVCEVLAANERVQEWILSDSESARLVEVMKESEFFGMQTFDQALLHLVKEGRLVLDEALPHARNIHELRAKAMEAGIQI